MKLIWPSSYCGWRSLVTLSDELAFRFKYMRCSFSWQLVAPFHKLVCSFWIHGWYSFLTTSVLNFEYVFGISFDSPLFLTETQLTEKPTQHKIAGVGPFVHLSEFLAHQSANSLPPLFVSSGSDDPTSRPMWGSLKAHWKWRNWKLSKWAREESEAVKVVT